MRVFSWSVHLQYLDLYYEINKQQQFLFRVPLCKEVYKEREKKKRPYFSLRASGAAVITPEDFVFWRKLQFSGETV